jgi:hypothetical protein
MNPLRISDIGDIRISGKANTLSQLLYDTAARSLGRVPSSVEFQDVDQFAPGYVRGLSKMVRP